MRYLLALVCGLALSLAEAQTLTQYYRNSECGLNWAYFGSKVTKRKEDAGGPGNGLPAPIVVTGIPPTYKVDKAWVISENQYFSGTPTNPNVTITAPGGASLSFNSGPIGTHVDKCWGEVGTRSYRYDITSIINGNGTYVFNSSLPQNDVDGAAIFIIYIDTTAAYQGTIIYYDGLFTNNVTGGAYNLTMTNLAPCSASSAGNAFMLVADYQLATHNTTLNGALGFYNAGFWQIDKVNTSVTATQTTATFASNATVTDCFSVVAAGLYFQTTACPLLKVSGNTTICPGDSATLTASGGKSFKWSPTTGLSSEYGQVIKAAPTATTTYTVSTKCETKTVTVVVGGPTALATTVTKTHCDQSDGGITVTSVTGGTAPYTYAIDGGAFGASNTFTSLSPGNHIVEAKDANGCTTKATVNIGNLPGITNIATSITDAICQNPNGKIEVTGVTGGTATYTYNINGGAFGASSAFSGLAPGNYKVGVKDVNGCEYFKDLVVANLPGPTNMTATIVNEACGQANGTITITGVTGGTAPYSYSIGGGTFGSSATFNPLAAGDHSIKVKDANNCEYTKIFKVNTTNGPTDIIATLTDESCGQANGSIKINSVSGGTSPYTYSIDGGPYSASTTYGSKAAGSYTISVKDNLGCTFDKVFDLNNTPPPSSVDFTTVPSGCVTPVGKITVSSVVDGQSPYTYSIDGTTYQAATTFSGLGSGAYQLFVKDALGCILVTPAQIGSTSGPSAVNKNVVNDSCGNSKGSIHITSVTGGSAPYTYSINSGSFGSSPIFSNLAAGQYTITVRDNTGCNYGVSITIDLLKGVSDFTMISAPEKCNAKDGELAVIDEVDGGSPFFYSLNGSPFFGSSNFPSLDSGSYSITVKDRFNCTLTKDAYVGYLPPLDSVQVQLTAATCSQSNGSAVFLAYGGTTPYTYSLDGGAFLAQSTASSLAATNHSVVVRDANNCVLSKPFTIANIAGPTTFTKVMTQTACATPTGTYTITSVTGGTQPYEYSFNDAAYEPTGYYDTLAAGTFPVKIRDANGCVLANTDSITVIAGPTSIQFTVVNTVCSQANGQVNISGSTGGTQPYTYSFNGGAFLSTQSYSNLPAGNYPMEVKDLNGCTAQDTAKLTNSGGPTGVPVTTTPTYCNQLLGTLTIGNVVNGSPGYLYSVNGSAFTSTKVYNNLSAGSYTVVVQDNNNCQYVAPPEVVANVAGPSSPVIMHADDTCGRNTGMVRFVSETGTQTPFSFSIDSGQTFTSGRLFQPLAPDTFYYVIKDTKGCTYSDTVVVRAITGPNAPYTTVTRPHCNLFDGSVRYTPSTVTSGTSPFTFHLNGVTNPPSNRFTGLDSGVYNLIVRDKYLCSDTAIVTITAIAGPSGSLVTTSRSTCSESNGSISVSGTTNGTLPITYSIDSVSWQASTLFSNKDAGNYKVYVKDVFGCTDGPYPAIVAGEPGPTGIDAGVLPENCHRGDGALLRLRSTSNNGTPPYVFEVGGMNYAEDDSVINIVTGKYTVNLTDANGCKFSEDFLVPFINAPVAAFVPTPTDGEAPLFVSIDNQSVDAVTNYWRFGNGDTSMKFEPTTTYNDSGFYKITLVVANEALCYDSISAYIRVKPTTGYYTPTAFSPNNDGFNDYFQIETYNIETYELLIYNRWGQLLTTLTPSNPRWDGTYLNEPAQDDVYPFRLRTRDILGKKQETYGKVVLFR